MDYELIKNQDKTDVLNNQDLTNSKSIVKYWEKEYITEKLDSIENKSHKTLFFTLWRSGMRITEALSIRRRDVNTSNYLLNIRWLKKRKALNRQVPMHPDLRNILDYYVTNLKADDLLFPISRQRAHQLCEKYFKGNCHMFRHSFAVNWLRSQGDLYLLSKMLGHSSIKVTEVYLQVVPVDIGKELLKVNF